MLFLTNSFTRYNQCAVIFSEVFRMIFGLTGAIGSGKSAVLSAFAKHNWITVDADKLCHSVYENATDDFIAGLKNIFGAECVDNNRIVNRKFIAQTVFNNKEALTKLENLIIPEFEKVFRQFIDDCKKNNSNAVCEVPLLFEKDYAKFFDAVIGIWTPDALRHERLKKFRNMSDEDIAAREKNQFSAEKKIELADYCIVNDGNTDDIERQIRELLRTVGID